MTLISLILTIVVVGIVMWAINQYIPMESGIKRLLNIAVIAILIFWILRVLGVLQMLNIPLR